MTTKHYISVFIDFQSVKAQAQAHVLYKKVLVGSISLYNIVKHHSHVCLLSTSGDAGSSAASTQHTAHRGEERTLHNITATSWESTTDLMGNTFTYWFTDPRCNKKYLYEGTGSLVLKCMQLHMQIIGNDWEEFNNLDDDVDDYYKIEFKDLPTEIWLQIVSNLSLKDKVCSVGPYHTHLSIIA